jgi:hypothetical protein
MRYTGLNPNGVNQIASGSVSVFVENTRVATFGTNTLQVTGSSVLSGSVAIIGPQTNNGNLTVTGSSTLSGSVIVQGNQNNFGNLTVTGSTILSSSLSVIGTEIVNGALLLTGSADISGSLSINGPIIVSGAFTVFTGSGVEFQVTSTGTKLGNLSTDTHSITGSTSISGSLNIIGATTYSNFGITYTTFQISGSTLSAIRPTASLYTVSIATSQSVAFNAIVTGYGTGSRDTITGEIKTTIKRIGGNATLIGTPFRYINADTSGSDINVGVSASIFTLSVTGSTSEPYNWFATITTQTV